jgi:hypothetical protein
METFTHTLDALWQVLVVGIAFGAGVPLMFACGIRFLAASHDEGAQAGTSQGNGTPHNTVSTTKRNVRGKIAAGLCFAVVLITVITGILFIMQDFLANDLGIHLF